MSSMEIWHWALLLLGGVFAGIANTLAGGGSLLTVPLLMLVGLEPNTANATNRIAILAQSTVSTVTFSRRGFPSAKLGLVLLPSGLLGAGLGAYLATIISNDAFRVVFGALMIPSILLVLFRPARLSQPQAATPSEGKAKLIIAFFFVGCYAGFIQAGVGLLALAALTLFGGLDLTHSNAVKVFTIAVFSALALVVFAIRLEIAVMTGMILASSMALGGYLGTLAAVKKGDRWVRVAVVMSCIALSVHMIFGN